MDKLLGSTLVTAKGESISLDAALGDAEYIFVYFSAHWCPPCRGFTPILSDFFTANGERLKFKVIFVSSDQDEGAFNDYFGSMSFGLALPYGDEHKDVIGKDVRGIPTLKLFKRDGTLLTADGRKYVTQSANGAGFPWV